MPSEDVIEGTLNSHFNEQWQDVTHSATDQPPARRCYPFTHLLPAPMQLSLPVCVMSLTHLACFHRAVVSAELVSLLMVSPQGGNICSVPCCPMWPDMNGFVLLLLSFTIVGYFSFVWFLLPLIPWKDHRSYRLHTLIRNYFSRHNNFSLKGSQLLPLSLSLSLSLSAIFDQITTDILFRRVYRNI